MTPPPRTTKCQLAHAYRWESVRGTITWKDSGTHTELEQVPQVWPAIPFPTMDPKKCTHTFTKNSVQGVQGSTVPRSPSSGALLKQCAHTEHDVAKPWPRTRARMDSHEHSVDLNEPNALHSVYIKFEKQQLFHGVRIYVRKEVMIRGSRERFLEMLLTFSFLIGVLVTKRCLPRELNELTLMMCALLLV